MNKTRYGSSYIHICNNNIMFNYIQIDPSLILTYKLIYIIFNINRFHWLYNSRQQKGKKKKKRIEKEEEEGGGGGGGGAITVMAISMTTKLTNFSQRTRVVLMATGIICIYIYI